MEDFAEMLATNRSIRKLKLIKLEIFEDGQAQVIAEAFSKMENLSELTFSEGQNIYMNSLNVSNTLYNGLK